MGRTWDEDFYTSEGYKIIQLIKNHDFTNFFWIQDPDEPILSKYIYGIGAQFDYKGLDAMRNPVFDYDLKYTRFISVFFGSVTVAIMVLFALEYFSPFVAIVAGLIFSTNPTYLALTQRVTIESILVFLFTACIYIFVKFLGKPSAKKSYVFGTLLGLSLIVKYSNILIVPLAAVFYFIFITRNKIEGQRKFFSKKIVFGFFLGLVQFILIWPMPWLHPIYMFDFEYKFRFARNSSPWEWFFGFPIHVPFIYYLVHFLIRTPELFLVLGGFGIYLAKKSDKWIYMAVLLWFSVPFIQSFYHFRMHGVRYIVQVYAPYAILIAIGLEKIIRKINRRVIGYFFILLFLGYSSFIVIKSAPYYLDYFNILVGGSRNVYKHNLFELGWWGEGGREAGEYIGKNAHRGTNVGYLLNPFATLKTYKSITYEPFDPKNKYDFVVINFYYFQKVGYNNPNYPEEYSQISRQYSLAYTVFADGAPLFRIYKIRQ